jgi:ABC-2 type transport system permease protein
MQQAMLFSVSLLMPFILLSGLATPIANMPDVFQWMTLIDPLRYALDITRRVYLEGAGLGQLIGDIWPMLLIGAVTLPIAAWMFRNRLT